MRRSTLNAIASFLVFFMTGTIATANEATKVTLEAGQTEVLNIPSGSVIDMNPKKILEIEPSGKGQIKVLAMRSGIVILKAKNETEERSWLIEILSRDQQSDWLLRSEWQSFFCAKEGVRCDLENKVISGETADLAWFYEARDVCKKKMPCSWQVLLSDAARNRGLIDLRPLMAQLKFALTRDGQIRIESSCDESDKKILDKVLTNLQGAYRITPQINCILRSPDLWSLDLLVVADRNGEGEASNPLQWERIAIPSRQPLKAYIAGLSQTSRMHVVAQPELSLSMGGTAVLRDGQEIQTLAVQKDSEEILWKASGFRLEVKLMEAKDNLLRLQLHLNLSQPQAGLRTIDASEFVTEIWMPTDILQRVGSMQANLDGNETHRIPWLSSIPLLGALFRWEGDSNSKSQIDIFLRIRPGALSEDFLDKEGSIERE